ncbi:MAG TPA: putative Ig domain-containing protein, partial [Polyangiaceae bacterium]
MPIHSHARWLATVPVLLLASGCAGSHSDSGTSLGGTGQVANQSNAGAGAGQANSSNLSQCGPTALPAWVEEGQSVSIAVLCATGRTVAGNAFTISELPAGAEYDPTTATLTWKPGLDQAGVYEVLVTVSPFNESGTIKIGVADAFDVAGNLPIADVTKYTEEYGLPVMHLTVPKQIEDNAVDPATGNKAWVPATIVYRGHTYSAEAKYRGASS